jgi:membrane protease YdiL (CAAX protease family)
MFVPFLVSTLLFGPLPEEIGWRGYGLESFQTKYSALQSSLIVVFLGGLFGTFLYFKQKTAVLQPFTPCILLVFGFGQSV